LTKSILDLLTQINPVLRKDESEIT